jgi:hypothetical protein
LSPPGDFFEDIGGWGGPDEGVWIGIMMRQVICDGRFEIGDAVKDAAADGILSDQAEEALDQIDPGRRSRREVNWIITKRSKP